MVKYEVQQTTCVCTCWQHVNGMLVSRTPCKVLMGMSIIDVPFFFVTSVLKRCSGRAGCGGSADDAAVMGDAHLDAAKQRAVGLLGCGNNYGIPIHSVKERENLHSFGSRDSILGFDNERSSVLGCIGRVTTH